MSIKMMISTLISLVVVISSTGAYAETSGSPMWDSEAYAARVNSRNFIPRLLTLGLYPPPALAIEFDEVLTGVFDDMEETSGFVIQDFMEASIPDVFRYNRWLVSLFPGMYYGWRDNLLARGDAAQEAGDWDMAAIQRVLGLAVAMPVKVSFFTVPANYDEYEIFMRMYYEDGSDRAISTHSYYNRATGHLGEPNGVAGLGYNVNLAQSYAYTINHSWQRALGYTVLYDIVALDTNDTVTVETVRLKFPYQGRDWMLQLWKGRYFLTSGAEIGLYNKPASRFIDFYDCATDEERIVMDMAVIAHCDHYGDIEIITRDRDLYWWVTGFGIRRYIYTADQMTVITNVFPTDAEMMAGMRAALDAHVADGTLTYEVTEEGALLITW